jgi:hypothetical protein
MPEYTPEAPLTDRLALDKAVGGYEPKGFPDPLPNIPYTSLDMSLPNLPSTITKVDGEPTPMAISAIENSILAARNGDGRQFGGSIPRSLAEVTSSRYDNFIPGDYNNEDAYAQGQGWTSKMVNDVGKGLALTAGTFLQGTLGVINGLARWGQDGRFASFYDNPENRAIDNAYKKLEDILPNYYKDVEKNAAWYSPTKLLSANFLWDGVVKNMGFAAGAALTGNVYAAGVRALAALPGLSRLVSVGKAAEVVAAGEEALLAANQPAALLGKVKGLSDKFLGQYNFLSPGGRAVVAGLSTSGEAGFEAFQNLNKFRDDKILEWKESHNGLEPMGADLDAINREADSVGNSSMALNIGLLTATNYIQFPKILGSSYKAEKGIISSLTREIDDLAKDAAGNLVSKEAVKEATRGFGGRLFSTVKKALPYTFSPSEAFEEGAQYVIGQASNDYYNKKYKGEATDFLASLSQGISDITNNEGMESVLIGGLSGAMMQVRDTYSTNKERVKDTATALELMNKWKFSSFTKDTIASVDRGTVIQQEREARLRQGDILMSKESERDYIINYLTPRIKYGRFDLVKADIDEYRALASTPDGFNQLVQEGKVVEGDTQPAYLQRINNLETTANNIKSTYQSLNLRYGGLLAEDGKSPLYRDEVIDKMIYAATKVADYDERIPELSSSLISKGIGVDIDSVINDVNAGNEDAYNEAVAQIEELEKTSKINVDQKLDLLRDLIDVAEMTTRRKKMLQEYSDMKNSPEKYETIPVKPESIAKKGVKAISIKTKDGDLEFEIGKEYYGDGPMKKSKEGIYYKDFTRFTVVGETESGKLILKTISNDPNVDGKVIEVDKSYFAKHQIKEFSALNKRPNEKFYVESAHFTFDYKTGGGKTIPGTIRYDRKTDKLTFVSADGKTKKTITRGDFTARKDYKEAKIVPRGKLTAKAQAALNEPLSEEEIKARVDTRNTIIAEAMTTLKEELAVVDEKIAKVKDNLAETKKKIDELAFTKDGKPRKSYVGAPG